MIQRYCEQLDAALGEYLPAEMADCIKALTHERLLVAPHGDQARWLRSLSQLPEIAAEVDAGRAAVTVSASQLPAPAASDVTEALKGLMPWRKGPFRFFDVDIDTEWHSDWKWDRVAPHLSSLAGRRVLDVGCGSGYHCWRMAAAGASFVLGIDPTILFLVQYLAVKRYASNVPVWFAPLRLEQITSAQPAFDTVFSMGVLYHRRSPLDHLQELMQLLEPGGELVLETLTVEGDERAVLMPADRYAMMRNVYFLPSEAMLCLWLSKVGFEAVKVVDISVTTVEEQRSTDWMQFQSLPDFLNPQDHSKTCEGYPAPRRAVVIARRPG